MNIILTTRHKMLVSYCWNLPEIYKNKFSNCLISKFCHLNNLLSFSSWYFVLKYQFVGKRTFCSQHFSQFHLNSDQGTFGSTNEYCVSCYYTVIANKTNVVFLYQSLYFILVWSVLNVDYWAYLGCMFSQMNFSQGTIV